MRLYYYEDISHSPDTTGTIISIQSFSEDYHLPIKDHAEENIKYDNVFSPRGMVVNDKGEIVPMKGVAESYFFGFLYRPFRNVLSVIEFLTIAYTILFFIFAIMINRLTLFNFGKSNLFLICILLVLFGLYSDRIINPYSFFTFCSIYFLSRYLKSHKKNDAKIFDKDLIFSSVSIAVAILFRYEYLIILIPLFVYLNILFYRKKVKFLDIVCYFVFPLLSIVIIFYSNKVLYGSPTTFSYMLAHNSNKVFDTGESQSFLSKLKSSFNLFLLYGFNPASFIKSLSVYILLLFPQLFFPLFALSKKDKRILPKKLILFISIYLVIYYGSNPNFYSYEQDKLYSSYVRYFAPIYLFLFTFSFQVYLRLYKSLNNKKYVMILLLIMSIFSFYNSNKYLFERDKIYAQKYVPEILNKVPSGSIVFSTIYDKLVYKNYQVATPSNKTTTFEDFLEVALRYYLDNPETNIVFLSSDDEEEKQILSFFGKEGVAIFCEDAGLSRIYTLLR